MNKITLFHLPNSRSHRILWLLEELCIPYDLVVSSEVNLDLIPDTAKPLKFPTIKISTPNGHSYLSETCAVADFLMAYTENDLSVPPKNFKDFHSYIYWKNFADGSFMPNVALKQVFSQITKQTPLPFRFVSYLFEYTFSKAYLDDALHQQLKSINDHLKQHDWLVSSKFSLADILVWFPLQANLCMRHTESYPNILNYLDRVHSRQAFLKSKELGLWNNQEFHSYWNI